MGHGVELTAAECKALLGFLGWSPDQEVDRPRPPHGPPLEPKACLEPLLLPLMPGGGPRVLLPGAPHSSEVRALLPWDPSLHDEDFELELPASLFSL